MASQREEPLPIAPNEYDALNERVNRRFQFLLMGAS